MQTKSSTNKMEAEKVSPKKELDAHEIHDFHRQDYKATFTLCKEHYGDVGFMMSYQVYK